MARMLITWHPCPIPAFQILTKHYCLVKKDAGSSPGARTRIIARLPYCRIARLPYLQMTIAHGGKTVNECGRQVGGGNSRKVPTGLVKRAIRGSLPSFPYRMHTRRARWARFSVLGIRPLGSIQIRYRVSGPSYLVPLPDCLS